jgi:hypothetical protein
MRGFENETSGNKNWVHDEMGENSIIVGFVWI